MAALDPTHGSIGATTARPESGLARSPSCPDQPPDTGRDRVVTPIGPTTMPAGVKDATGAPSDGGGQLREQRGRPRNLLVGAEDAGQDLGRAGFSQLTHRLGH